MGGWGRWRREGLCTHQRAVKKKTRAHASPLFRIETAGTASLLSGRQTDRRE